MMKPSASLYWIRAVLGVIIGVISALYNYLSGQTSSAYVFSINDLFTGVAFALLFFLITYYLLKPRYVNQFEKKSKLITTGIGIYFFMWIIVWVMIFTILRAMTG